jgi:hypothetical protein
MLDLDVYDFPPQQLRDSCYPCALRDAYRPLFMPNVGSDGKGDAVAINGRKLVWKLFLSDIEGFLEISYEDVRQSTDRNPKGAWL